VVVAAHVLAGSAVIRAAKKNAVPVVYDLKDWFPQSAAAYYDNRFLKWSIYQTVWAITKYNLDHSDVITTVSPSLVERLDRCGYPSRLITNGVNTDYFRPLPAKAGKQKLGIDPETFVIGFVGSIERFFNLDFVIRALPALLDSRDAVKLVIVGGSLFTDYESELKRLVRELNLTDSVLFTGSVPYESLPEYVAAMDVCLIPYASEIWDNHALPNKFFEYSACGKAILSTPIPDVMQIAQDNYFVYRDREEYLKTIAYLMDNPKEYRLDLSEYSWQRKAREFEAIFEDLTG
jgi:phosphatidylinositol alpha-1,6-mannosyltransferase